MFKKKTTGKQIILYEQLKFKFLQNLIFTLKITISP